MTCNNSGILINRDFSKGYIWFTAVVASTHVLHCLNHAGVWPVPPASVVIPLIAHSHLDAGQDTAGQHRSHAGQSGEQKRRHSRFLFMSRLGDKSNLGVRAIVLPASHRRDSDFSNTKY